ncbi:MAG: hypothetical protein NTU98_03825 [Bacteroidetes bacterium]|nr:hypothetical protein [Bacteroidota bacterium]
MKKAITVLFILGFCWAGYCASFPPVNRTPQESEVRVNGFILKKWVSVTTEYSGVPFNYSIFYTIPDSVDPATVIIITDEIPKPLIVASSTDPDVVISPPTATSTKVTYTVPVGNKKPGMYYFRIDVSFPAGTTCDGDFADNSCVMTTIPSTGKHVIPDPGLKTAIIRVTAVAVDNPFIITKSSPLPKNGQYHAAVGYPVEYYLTLSKPAPFYYNKNGQQNLSTIIVTDYFPAGATYVPGSFQVLFVNCTTGAPVITDNSLAASPNIQITIPFLPSSDETPTVQFSYKIDYPALTFPAGATAHNCASYTATSCGKTVTSNTSCIDVVFEAAAPGGKVGKELHLENPVPGCNGFYRLLVTNSGNNPLPEATVIDNIPNEVDVTSIGFNTAYYNSNPLLCKLFVTGISGVPQIVNVPASNSFSWPTLADPNTVGIIKTIKVIIFSNQLKSGGTYGIDLYFTVKNNPVGTPVNNRMDITYDPASNLAPDFSEVSFTIAKEEPKLCLLKSVVDPKPSYKYGDKVRFSLRIQNIGSGPLTGAIITDHLSSNFDYANGENYLISTSGVTNSWPPVTPQPNHAGQDLKWILPPISQNCKLYNWVYGCDVNGVPYYIIEYDVIVNQLALAGSVPNFFTVSGGNLVVPKQESNTVYVTVTSKSEAKAEKFISVDNGVTWSKSASAAPGDVVMYRLWYKNNSNYPVSDVILFDLLPINFGYGPADDRMILDRNNPNNRGSQFDLTYSTTLNSPYGTLPDIKVNNVPAPSSNNPYPTVKVNNDLKVCIPELGITTNCTPGSWNTNGNLRNVKFEFGSNYTYKIAPITNLPITKLQPGDELTLDYKVQISPGTSYGLKACNSFAVTSTGYYFIDNVQQIVKPTPWESDVACLTSAIKHESSCDNCCKDVKIDISPNSVVKMGQNWYVKTTLTTAPDRLYEIKAAMVNFYMNEQAGCERCVPSNIFFGSMLPTNNPGPYQTSQIDWNPPNGSWVSPYLNTYAGSPFSGSLRELVWHKMVNGQYVSRKYLSSEEVYFRIVFPKVFPNQCCKDTINFCVRWSFTDTTCRTCDTLICYTVYPEPWQGNGQVQPVKGKEKDNGKIDMPKQKGKKEKKAKPGSNLKLPESPVKGIMYPEGRYQSDSAGAAGYNTPDTLIKIIKSSQPPEGK